MTERSERFGKQLKALRNARGLTQKQLGELAGVHHITVAKWEGGEIEPSGRNLHELSRVLRASVPALLGEPKPETEQALGAYKASAWARLRAEEGAPLTAIEEEFLRYVIESAWREVAPPPRALDSILEAVRRSPGLLPSE